MLEYIFGIILGILEEGFLYGIMALGVYITYKILDFPDLSVDGTFPLGGAVTAILIVLGVNPFLTLLISFVAGALAGVVTGFIHVRFKVRDLLSGIIVMTALYSINLRIAGKSNVSIFSQPSIFDNNLLDRIPDSIRKFTVVIILGLITLVMKLLLDFYLKTKSGFLLRAVGDNQVLVTSLAKDQGKVKIIGLALANGFVALAGCIYTQKNGYFEISMGTGTIVIGLASVIIGINIFKNLTFVKATTAVILGSIIYKACVASAISLGMVPSDLRLVTSILFLAILILSYERKRRIKQHA
ncbi:MAG: inner-rane translocator [Anaerocolumna sp.]|jgi:putative ABC transport system permease protein|nr:inner-rane translocator [Anaerocolumna sp.]